MSGGGGKKSLQDVLRARREATSLLSPAEAAEREAARRREEAEAEAASALERWRERPFSRRGGKLSADGVSRALPAQPGGVRGKRATGGGARRPSWRSAPACEVERCGAADASARHLTHATLGEEEPGRDLITLCDGCQPPRGEARPEARPPARRDEIVQIDPAGPLYEPDEIAALKAKYAPRR